MNKYLNLQNLKEVRDIYKKGKNVSEYLRKKLNKNNNNSEVIEISYDLQAGSYIEYAKSNSKKISLLTNEFSQILNKHLDNKYSLLDVGAGELTNLTFLLNKIKKKPSKVFAFDISWSRIYLGKKFFEKNIKDKKTKLSLFCADIKSIPLKSNSIDVIISIHALEPNGKNLSYLIKELFRVVKKKLILFEPSYELSSLKAKKRMNKLGYIKNIKSIVENLGGSLAEMIPIKNITNRLNQTACYIVYPPKKFDNIQKDKFFFCAPGTNLPLKKDQNFYVSKEIGLAYPIFKEIPLLKKSSSILASGNFKYEYKRK